MRHFSLFQKLKNCKQRYSLDDKKHLIKRKCFLSFSFLIIILVANANSFSEISKHNRPPVKRLNRITGFVFDQNRNVVPNIFVELQDELYRTLTAVKTDSSGRYIFSGMSTGTFYLRVVPGGTNFIEQIVKVELVSLSQNGSQSNVITQDFYLIPRNVNSKISNLQTKVIFAQEIPKEAESAYKQGLSNIENKRNAEAIRNIEEALIIFPAYFIALNRLGYIYFEQAEYAEASEYFARAADVNPKSEPTIFFLAYSVYLTKRFDVTISILKGAIAQKHTTARIYLLFGKCYRAKKNFEESEKKLKRAESLNINKDPEIHWELAKLYGNDLKKYKEAADQLELFLKLQTDSQDENQIKKLIEKFREKSKKE